MRVFDISVLEGCQAEPREPNSLYSISALSFTGNSHLETRERRNLNHHQRPSITFNGKIASRKQPLQPSFRSLLPLAPPRTYIIDHRYRHLPSTGCGSMSTLSSRSTQSPFISSASSGLRPRTKVPHPLTSFCFPAIKNSAAPSRESVSAQATVVVLMQSLPFAMRVTPNCRIYNSTISL